MEVILSKEILNKKEKDNKNKEKDNKNTSDTINKTINKAFNFVESVGNKYFK